MRSNGRKFISSYGQVCREVEFLLQHRHFLPQLVDVSPEVEENLVENLSLVLEAVVALTVAYLDKLGALRVLRNELFQHVGGNLACWAENGDLLCEVFQLSDISRPLVAFEYFLLPFNIFLCLILLCGNLACLMAQGCERAHYAREEGFNVASVNLVECAILVVSLEEINLIF